jgi:hypothetical protein
MTRRTAARLIGMRTLCPASRRAGDRRLLRHSALEASVLLDEAASEGGVQPQSYQELAVIPELTGPGEGLCHYVEKG